ncbi:unnamed protein product [Amoebophrya sp. A120]|nr:unnamed protein product [Amoebophrya sp. A120]|eukprot:GSA120T00018676001.1
MRQVAPPTRLTYDRPIKRLAVTVDSAWDLKAPEHSMADEQAFNPYVELYFGHRQVETQVASKVRCVTINTVDPSPRSATLMGRLFGHLMPKSRGSNPSSEELKPRSVVVRFGERFVLEYLQEPIDLRCVVRTDTESARNPVIGSAVYHVLQRTRAGISTTIDFALQKDPTVGGSLGGGGGNNKTTNTSFSRVLGSGGSHNSTSSRISDHVVRVVTHDATVAPPTDLPGEMGTGAAGAATSLSPAQRLPDRGLSSRGDQDDDFVQSEIVQQQPTSNFDDFLPDLPEQEVLLQAPLSAASSRSSQPEQVRKQLALPLGRRSNDSLASGGAATNNTLLRRTSTGGGSNHGAATSSATMRRTNSQHQVLFNRDNMDFANNEGFLRVTIEFLEKEDDILTKEQFWAALEQNFNSAGTYQIGHEERAARMSSRVFNQEEAEARRSFRQFIPAKRNKIKPQHGHTIPHCGVLEPRLRVRSDLDGVGIVLGWVTENNEVVRGLCSEETFLYVAPGYVRVAFDNEAYHRDMIANVKINTLKWELPHLQGGDEMFRSNSAEDTATSSGKKSQDLMVPEQTNNERGADQDQQEVLANGRAGNGAEYDHVQGEHVNDLNEEMLDGGIQQYGTTTAMESSTSDRFSKNSGNGVLMSYASSSAADEYGSNGKQGAVVFGTNNKDEKSAEQQGPFSTSANVLDVKRVPVESRFSGGEEDELAEEVTQYPATSTGVEVPQQRSPNTGGTSSASPITRTNSPTAYPLLPQGENAVAIGRFVRVRKGVRPMRGWGSVSVNDIGLCVQLRARLATVTFAHQRMWRAFVDELECVEVAKIICLRELQNNRGITIPRGAQAGVVSRHPQPNAEPPFVELLAMVCDSGVEELEGQVLTVSTEDEGTLYVKMVEPRRSSILVDPLELATREDLRQRALQESPPYSMLSSGGGGLDYSGGYFQEMYRTASVTGQQSGYLGGAAATHENNKRRRESFEDGVAVPRPMSSMTDGSTNGGAAASSSAANRDHIMFARAEIEPANPAQQMIHPSSAEFLGRVSVEDGDLRRVASRRSRASLRTPSFPATEEERFAKKMQIAQKAEQGERLARAPSSVVVSGSQNAGASASNRATVNPRSHRSVKKLNDARATNRDLIRSDPEKWCAQFWMTKPRSGHNKFAAPDGEEKQLSLEEARSAILKTFHVEKFQRSALKRLLTRRWVWPLSKQDLLTHGQLAEGDQACLINVHTLEVTLDEKVLTHEGQQVKILGRVDDKYAIELEVGSPLILVKRENLDTTRVLALAETPPPGQIRVKGAGGAGIPCNGDYQPSGSYRDHPMYKNESGAIIYWAGFWKMNYTDQVTGWYYAHDKSHGMATPPEGQWSNYGYNGRRAFPCPFLSRGNLPFPRPTEKLQVGNRCVLAVTERESVTSSVNTKIVAVSPVLTESSVGEVVRRDEDDRLLVRNLQTGLSAWHSPEAVHHLEGMTHSEMLARNFAGGTRETFIAWVIDNFTTFVLVEDENKTTGLENANDAGLTAIETTVSRTKVLDNGKTRRVGSVVSEKTEEDLLAAGDVAAGVIADGTTSPSRDLRADVGDGGAGINQFAFVDGEEEVTHFERVCVQEAIDEIDKIRKRFGWPLLKDRPKPAEGCPELVFSRPETGDFDSTMSLLLDTFARIGTRSGEFWTRGFTIKFRQDRGIDWGAVTKSWANLLCAQIFHPDSGLLTSGLSPSVENSTEDLKCSGFFLPDWAALRLGREPGMTKVWYEFLGRFLAYCLYMNCRVEAVLGGYVYSCLLCDMEVDESCTSNAAHANALNPSAGNKKGVPQQQQQLRPDAIIRPVKEPTAFNVAQKNRRSSAPSRRIPTTNFFSAPTRYEMVLPAGSGSNKQQLFGPVWKSVYDCVDDLRTLDPVKAKGLMDLLEYPDADDVELVFCLDFSVSYKFMGEEILFLLCPAGDDRPVTGENRQEYVFLLCQFLLKASCHFALSSFVRGFRSVLPRKCIRMLSPKLLEGLLCGQSDVRDRDWAELRDCVVVSLEGTLMQDSGKAAELKETLISNWFFSILYELEPKARQQLLNFWIGTTRVPAVGFRGLHPVINLSLTTSLLKENLPQTHICFHKLDLPVYDSKEQMKAKLVQAIELAGAAVSME